MSIPRGKYTFHSYAGRLAQIANEGLTATRKNPSDDFRNAVLIGAQPLEDGKMFEVRIEKESSWASPWAGSIKIGCTTAKPGLSWRLPSSLCLDSKSESELFFLVADSWIMTGTTLVKAYRQRVFRLQCELQRVENYGYDIDSLDVGDAVGIARVGRKLKFYVNGSDQGTAEDNLPPVVYPVVDLYGICSQVSIVLPCKFP